MATKQYIRITSKIEGFRRAGLVHSRAATDYPREAITDKQLAQLEAEPNLVVQQIDKEVEAPTSAGDCAGNNSSGATLAPSSQQAGQGDGTAQSQDDSSIATPAGQDDSAADTAAASSGAGAAAAAGKKKAAGK